MQAGGMSPGRFITLEGGEGAGKTTQSALLAEALAQRNIGPCGPANPAAHRCRAFARHPAGRHHRLVAASRDLAAFRRPRRTRGQDHPTRTGRRHLGHLRPLLRLDPGLPGLRPGRRPPLIAEQIRLIGIHADLTLILDVPEAIAADRMRRAAATPTATSVSIRHSTPRAAGFSRNRRRRTRPAASAGRLG